MITAVDTNILLEILDTTAGSISPAELDLTRVQDDGPTVICEVVYAEMASRFAHPEEQNSFLTQIEVELVASNPETLFLAGVAWTSYARGRPSGLVCSECGAETPARCARCESVISIRQRSLPDLYVGAHASVHADRLLTRDQRYYRSYFPELELV